MALIAHAATLEARVPFLHFFDGFRTSSEVNKIERLAVEDLRAMIDDQTWSRPIGPAASPRSSCSARYCPEPGCLFPGTRDGQPLLSWLAQKLSKKRWIDLPALVGRQYNLFDYIGDPQAERVIVMMGSGAETAGETAKYPERTRRKSRCLGSSSLPPILGRTLYRGASRHRQNRSPFWTAPKNPAVQANRFTRMYLLLWPKRWTWQTCLAVIGGRYGLSSKEFTPAMVKAVYDELLKAEPKNHFTVGIIDDVTHTSLDYDPTFFIEITRDCPLHVLGFGFRWYRRRKQELDQNYR